MPNFNCVLIVACQLTQSVSGVAKCTFLSRIFFFFHTVKKDTVFINKCGLFHATDEIILNRKSLYIECDT